MRLDTISEKNLDELQRRFPKAYAFLLKCSAVNEYAQLVSAYLIADGKYRTEALLTRMDELEQAPAVQEWMKEREFKRDD